MSNSEEPQEIKLHIVLSDFDDVIGPEILISVPPIRPEFFESVSLTLPHLMDIDAQEVKFDPFIYSNELHSSHNISFKLPYLDGRGLEHEYLLSLLSYPADRRVLMSLVGFRDFLLDARDEIVPIIIQFHSQKNRDNFIIEITEVFRGLIDHASTFMSAQLEVWGTDLIRLSEND